MSQKKLDKVLVEIPNDVHVKILEWAEKSGMTVKEFLRLSLSMGAYQLAENLQVKKPDEGYQN